MEMTAQTPTQAIISAAATDPLIAIRANADKIMCMILAVVLIYSFALTSWYNSYNAFYMVGLPVAGIGMLLTWFKPGKVLTRMFVASAFMILTALTIHQARGMIEMHFGFFALLAVLLFYRDWWVYVPATLVAAMHHISFNYFQELNYGVFCFTKTGWNVVAIHVGYVVFEVTILVYMAEMMRREAVKASKLLSESDKANSLLTEQSSTMRELAVNGSRVKAALDAVTINIRVADKDGNIVYLNPALVNALTKAQDELRKRDPNFDPNNMIGKSVGVLYEDSETALSILRTQRIERQADVTLGGRQYKLISNPIISADGTLEGTIGQWIDKTDELRAQSEIAELVKAAAAGDLSHRINLEGKKDFFLELAQNVNQMVASTDGVINETVGALERIANGDMTHTIDTEYQGAYGVIKDNANLTIARLTDIVTQIKAVANAINVSAAEISAGHTDLSQRTEEQASSLEETASSMEEMASTVKQNAENALEANKLAFVASEMAVWGSEVVGGVVSTMSDISASSKKMGEIVSVIDGIAFQTNILALNAAVEAARAGEQGRGFAVVAAEVRSLAQRSAVAAKEIKQMIGESVEKIAGGSKLVKEAGNNMDEIVTAVKKVTQIVGEIASASQEQSAGIDQVNNAITNMDEVTQQNAALVEQAAAASNAMGQQTQSLIDSVAVFKLNTSQFNTTQINNAHNSRADEITLMKMHQPKAIAEKSVDLSPKQNSKKTDKKTNKIVNKENDWEEF
jgi:methyl-accepting chemotaxis protein